jgi:chromosome segregation ATPase
MFRPSDTDSHENNSTDNTDSGGGMVFGFGSKKEDKKESNVQQNVARVSEKRDESNSESRTTEKSSSSRQVDNSASGVKELTGLGRDEDASFQQAGAKSKAAENAARVAHENADKAIKLLHISEESSKEVEELRKQHELRLQKLEELAAQDKDAKALKENYAAARQAAQQKAADYDKVREAARALNKELEEKNKQLKDQQNVVDRLSNQQQEAAQKKTTIITTVKDLNTGEPDAKEKAAKARSIAADKGDALQRLRNEVQAEEQRAADLEAQAKAARESARNKANQAAELEKDAQQHVATAERLEAAHKEMTDRVQVEQTKIQGAEQEAAKLAKERDAAEDRLSQLAAELEDINRRAEAKLEEANKKRAEYDEEKQALDGAAKQAVEASATLKDHAQVRETIVHEKEQLAERVEKTETKLVQDTEASKKALKEAEDAENLKKAKWAEAEAAGKAADQFASNKLSQVESALNKQMGGLMSEAKDIKEQSSSTKVDKKASATQDKTVTQQAK